MQNRKNRTYLITIVERRASHLGRSLANFIWQTRLNPARAGSAARLRILYRIIPILAFSAVGIAQTETSSAMAEVASWIDKAVHEGDPVAWANDLMKADAAAEKLEQEKESGCCGVRCVRIGTFELRFNFDSLAGRESYQHDLLKDIAMVHEGDQDGAEALVRLLPTGCQTMSNQWIPLFRTVLGILETKRWKDLGDLRLTAMRGEAYETWWSLSKMNGNDGLVTDAQMNPTDFADGAERARQRAIAAYEALLKAHRASADVVHRLAELRAGRDTQMRKWICFSD